MQARMLAVQSVDDPLIMKPIGQAAGLRRIRSIKSKFAEEIRTAYEPNAKSCLTCETKGACCLDAHFVNVHVTPLEAAAINEALDEHPAETRSEIERRVGETITKYKLTDTGDTLAQTYACPLFEPATGCLVHDRAKPLPCIHHACYENEYDLPPDRFLDEAATEVERLNKRVFGATAARWLPLPLAIARKE